MASASKGISFVTYNGSPTRRIIKVNTQRDGLREGEVLIRITHSSLCGTDEHYLGKDMCLGHEGAGVIVELGPGIQHLKV